MISRMASAAVLQRLQQRSLQAEQIIAALRTQIYNLKANAVAEACKEQEQCISGENQVLRREVIQLKQRLIQAEVNNGVKQVPLPSAGPAAVQMAAPPQVPAAKKQPAAAPDSMQPPQEKKAKKEKKPAENKPKQQQGGAADNLPIDVSRLDMRIGKIVNVKKHPDADSLYVEDVDLGEGRNRTIVSGLVKHVPIEEMHDRLAIFTCNLKPAKMRGILSEGMIMCGSSPEKVEIIIPPEGSAIGDRVACEGYTGTPDTQLNPKKKIFEQVQPDLRINTEGVATYKGTPWKVADRPGPCTVPTMRDSNIK